MKNNVFVLDDMESKCERKANGVIILDGIHAADTLQCAHCGAHWISQRGSRIRRGFCMKCQGPLCGQRGCLLECMPFEKRLDLYERRKLISL